MKRCAIALSLLTSLAACKGKKEDKKAIERKSEQARRVAPAPVEEEADMGMDDDVGGTGTKMAQSEGKMGRKPSAKPGGRYAMQDMKAEPELDKAKQVAEQKLGSGEVGETQSRSWFPETFLFEPLIVTDASGAATVAARVPDRLTNWRVLALAHARNGRQAGATTSFLGTLEKYVEVVVPPTLRVGDRADIPVQVVNTGDAPLRAALQLTASGARIAGGGAVSVAAGGSSLSFAKLTATEPGTVQVLARLGGADAVTRELEVRPTGRPLVETRSGTLAQPRKLKIDFAGETTGSFARLSVYSGARALLSEELSRAAARGGVDNDAFALMLIGQAPELMKKFGLEADAEALRKSRIILTQRAVRHARVMSLAEATLLARAVAAHEGDPVLSSLATRARGTISGAMLPDGTCGGSTGWQLQRLLVSTADCVRAAEDDRRTVLLAEGAFERNAEHVDDPYTAAVVLATGAGSPEARDAWKELVGEAVEEDARGNKLIRVPEGVRRTDGSRPSDIEATAMAVLALDPGELRSELGATVLGYYRPGAGWGDGRTNLVGMQAVIELFSDPLPGEVRIELHRDGQKVAAGTINPKKSGEVFVLEARDAKLPGGHEWEVVAEPAVPGLAFSLESRTYGPWPDNPKGLEIAVTPPEQPRLGRRATIGIRAQVPAQAVKLRVLLPAGVVADTQKLDEQVSAGTVTSYESQDGVIELRVPAPDAGRPLSLQLAVVPTISGRLSSGPVILEVGGTELFAPPSVWTIRR